MKNKLNFFWMAFLLAAIFASCEENFIIEGSGIVQAPILRDIVLPDANNSNPGTEVVIQGKGFADGDKVYLKNDSGLIEVIVKAVAEGSLTFEMPENAGGEYSVEVERANLKTQLPGTFFVPYLLVLKDVVLPSGNFERGAQVTIEAEGFVEGDSIYLLNDDYPSSTIFKVKGTVTENALRFTVPEGTYGENTVVAVRWENGNARKGSLGIVGVKSNVGDVIGGGVVYYMMDEVHGFICNNSNITAAAVAYGPSCVPIGTTAELGDGKENSEKLLEQITNWRSTGEGEWLTAKTVVELCDEYTVTVDGLVYDDWYLPSENELSELFKVRELVGENGATFKNDNYWTSTEVVGDGWAWAQRFVNFYEPVNLVTGNANRIVWKIGVIPIRTF